VTILFLSIEFNYCCGISRSIFSLSKELKKKGHRILLGSPGGTMVADFISNGFEQIYFPIHPDNKKIKDALHCIRLLKTNVKKYDVDIIHSHHRLAEFYALIGSTFNKISTISTAHALIAGKKSLSFRSDKLIAVSDIVKEMLVSDFKVQERKINVIRNIPRKFCDPSVAGVERFKEKAGIEKADFVVAGIGRLHTEKGFDVFLSAMKALSDLKHVRAILAGKGVEKTVLQQYSLENKINIFFADEINEVELIYKCADVIVVPSRQESAGLVAIEAGYFQKPVIASSVGGLNETIKDGVTGLSVMPENPGALAEAIRKLYMDRQFCQILGKQLSDYVEKEYAADKISDQVQLVYKQLMHDHGRS